MSYKCKSCGHTLTDCEVEHCMGNCPKCGRDSLVEVNPEPETTPILPKQRLIKRIITLEKIKSGVTNCGFCDHEFVESEESYLFVDGEDIKFRVCSKCFKVISSEIIRLNEILKEYKD